MKIFSKIPGVASISQVLTAVGFLLLIIERFSALSVSSETHLHGLALTVLGVSLIIQIELIFNRLDAIQESIRVLKRSRPIRKTIAEIEESLQLSDSISDLNQKATSGHPKKIHISAAVDALLEVVEMQHKHNLREVAKLTNSNNGAEVKDISSAFGMLEKLEKNLPHGSVWLGITHLADSKLWEHKGGGEFFARYITDMHQKTSDGHLLAFRIFCFPDDQSYAKMVPVMQKEIDAKVKVKYLIDPKPPTDMSIIWHSDIKKNSDINEDELSKSLSLLEFMKQKKYHPLCSLTFSTRNWHLLQSVIISNPESKNFIDLCGEFCESWKIAKSL